MVDDVGGNAKSLVRAKVMSKSSDVLIVQSAKDFSLAAASLMPSTKVIFISEIEIKEFLNAKKLSDNVPSVPGITTVHVIHHQLLTNKAVFQNYALDE